MPLASLPRGQLFGLQVGSRRADLKHIINGTTIINATSEINDYADTATTDKATEPYNFSRYFCCTPGWRDGKANVDFITVCS